MEGGVVADLVAPAVEEVVGDGEEEGEEDGVGEVEREREGVGGFGTGRTVAIDVVVIGGRRGRAVIEEPVGVNRRFRRSPSDIH